MGSRAKADATFGVDGATVGELPDTVERFGDHDIGTIGIQTTSGGKAVDKTTAAARLKHEARHRKNAKDKNRTEDPDTVGRCGACLHAEYHFDDIVGVDQELCETLAQGSLQDHQRLAAICASMRENFDAGEERRNGACSECLSVSGDPLPARQAKEKSDAAKARMENCCGNG